MSVHVTCPRCGTEHASRMRARSHDSFTSLNEAIGAVLEQCPSCGATVESHPADRSWHDGPGRTRRHPALE